MKNKPEIINHINTDNDSPNIIPISSFSYVNNIPEGEMIIYTSLDNIIKNYKPLPVHPVIIIDNQKTIEWVLVTKIK